MCCLSHSQRKIEKSNDAGVLSNRLSSLVSSHNTRAIALRDNSTQRSSLSATSDLRRNRERLRTKQLKLCSVATSPCAWHYHWKNRERNQKWILKKSCRGVVRDQQDPHDGAVAMSQPLHTFAVTAKTSSHHLKNWSLTQTSTTPTLTMFSEANAGPCFHDKKIAAR